MSTTESTSITLRPDQMLRLGLTQTTVPVPVARAAITALVRGQHVCAHPLAITYRVSVRRFLDIPREPRNGLRRPSYAGEPARLAGRVFSPDEPTCIPAEALSPAQAAELLTEHARPRGRVDVEEFVPVGFADGVPWRREIAADGSVIPRPAAQTAAPVGVVHLRDDQAAMLGLGYAAVSLPRRELDERLARYLADDASWPPPPHPLAIAYEVALRDFSDRPMGMPEGRSGAIRPPYAGEPVTVTDNHARLHADANALPHAVTIGSGAPSRYDAHSMTAGLRRRLLAEYDRLVVTEIVPSGYGNGTWRREEPAQKGTV